MTTLQQIGQQIHTQRRRLKLFQNELAARSKVNRNTLSQLEAGTANVELNTLIALCDELGLEIVLVPRAVAALVAPSAPPAKSARSRKRERILNAVVKAAP